MQNIIKKLSNKRQANVFFKDTELTQLTRIIDTLQSVKEEKELNAQIAAEAEEKERQELEAIRTQILEKGLSFDKLASLMKPSKKPRKVKKTSTEKTKLCYVFDDNKRWNGEGEVPQDLQSLLDEGYELADFLQSE
ncbi:H-NS family nucleoid-associated regulatory protein [Vibrio splendidus]|uniref:DNA-binding protein n=1 Tax=Vibrio splendidus 12E03 TaxID=1191305 RepID=A0A1E5FC03_VIBSP|nr:H-NS family nucleoid-associated regulatory protein [Vibrio splendidus]OEF85188.1 DNA-binding protein [Vibrio splendidus 12E03]